MMQLQKTIQKSLKKLPLVTRKGIHYFIFFLIVMMVLTLLSNMASGVTIARVTAVYPTDANISDNVDASGIVSAKSKETILIPQDIKVERIIAGLGSKVKNGDELLLFNIDDLDSKIKELKINVMEMEADVQSYSLVYTSTASLEEEQDQNQLNSAKIELDELQSSFQRNVDKAEREYSEANRDYSRARREFRSSNSSENDVVTALSKLDKAETKLENARNNFNAKKNTYDKLLDAFDNSDALIAAKKELDIAEQEMAALEKSYQDRLQDYEDAISEAAGSEDEVEQQANRDYDQLKNARNNLYNARTALEEAKISLKVEVDKAKRNFNDLKLQSDISSINRKNAQQDVLKQSLKGQAEKQLIQLQIEQAQKKISLMSRIKENGGKLNATVDGTLIHIDVDENNKLSGEDAIQIATAEHGYEATAKISLDDSKGLSIGMNAIVEIDGTTVTGMLFNINAYPDDDKQIEISIKLPDESSWQDGQLAEIILERSRKKYDLCIPLGALRTDSNGDFVYVLEDMQTILGIQTTLRRVPVEVLMSDDNIVAIKGAVSQDNKILITSNKLVNDKDRVRLIETSST